MSAPTSMSVSLARLGLVLAVAIAGTAAAQSMRQVLPNTFDAMDGGTALAWPWQTVDDKTEFWVFDSGEFLMQAPLIITQVYHRVDPGEACSGATFPDVTIRMGRSVNDHASQDSTWANNYAPGSELVVHTGPLTFPSTPVSVLPTGQLIALDLQVPYPYDPSLGQDLIIEVRKCGTVGLINADVDFAFAIPSTRYFHRNLCMSTIRDGLTNGGPIIYIDYQPAGASCMVAAPLGVTTGPMLISVDAMSPALPPTVTLNVEWSPAGAGTFALCTMTAASPNPNGVTGPAGPYTFEWDTAADAVGGAGALNVDIRVTATDSIGVGTCVAAAAVDNQAACSLTAPMGVVVGAVLVGTTSTTQATPADVDLLLEWSPAGLGTFLPATTTAGSATPNPSGTVPAGVHEIEWDARSDGAAIAAPETVDLRLTVTDSLGTGTCTTTVDLDNTSLCGGICGDCDLNGSMPSILDALAGAQISAGLLVPTIPQTGCCDVNSSGTIEVLDALLMAQNAAGLPATLVCP